MQTSFPLSGRRAATERQPDAVLTTTGVKPLDRTRHEKKVVRKIYDEPVCGLLRAFRQPTRERGGKGLKTFCFIFNVFYFNLLSRSCQLRSFRNYPRPRPLLGRAPKKNIHVTVMLLRTLGGQRSALYHSKAYLVLGGAPHPGPKTLLPNDDLEVGGRRS